jgi:hypothetical protein
VIQPTRGRVYNIGATREYSGSASLFLEMIRHEEGDICHEYEEKQENIVNIWIQKKRESYREGSKISEEEQRQSI